MPEYKRTIRRGQAITPYGTGAIIDYKGESFVACNAEQWRDQGERIHESRLQRLLHRQHFRLAPAARNDNDPHPNLGLPVVRFPDWLFCRRCRFMSRWSERARPEETRIYCPRCRTCDDPLTPMRFIIVCPHGHMDDVPWDAWCHDGQPCPRAGARLQFFTGEQRGGLEDLSISCECGARRTLEGITRPDALRGIIPTCPGRQPWEQPTFACPILPVVKQRGATNIHFAQTVSSIDIPPYSANRIGRDLVDAIMASTEYGMYVESPDDLWLDRLSGRLVRKLSPALGEIDVEEVREVLRRGASGQVDMSGGEGRDYQSEEDLKEEEYEAFLSPRTTNDPDDFFQKRDVRLTDARLDGEEHARWNSIVAAMAALMDRLVLITRLREVRVISSFTRLADDGETVQAVRSDTGRSGPERVREVPVARRDTDWLPAVEVFGEGIFFTFDLTELDRWAGVGGRAAQRARVLRDRQARVIGGGGTLASPQFLLLHSFTHLLIRQLSFMCGYGASSLRERLYCTIGQTGNTLRAGALIYTSAGDSEGTLGGLVRQGEPQRFITTAVDALRNASWCSSDPLCQESDGQGINALNLAACHACSLLPETSCSERNRVLDRAVVVGLAEDPGCGYFAPVLRAATI